MTLQEVIAEIENYKQETEIAKDHQRTPETEFFFRGKSFAYGCVLELLKQVKE
jgi:hypothetical protein